MKVGNKDDKREERHSLWPTVEGVTARPVGVNTSLQGWWPGLARVGPIPLPTGEVFPPPVFM